MTAYITSDMHLGHANLLRHEPWRGERWPTIEAMDAEIIEQMRACVSGGNTLLHVGDLAMCGVAKLSGYLDRIMARSFGNLRLLPGNHDGKPLSVLKRDGELPERVELLPDIYVSGRAVFCHYPIESWPGMAFRPEYADPHRTEGGTLHFHGHSHGHGRRMPDRLDVSYDAHRRILTLAEAVQMAEAGIPTETHGN